MNKRDNKAMVASIQEILEQIFSGICNVPKLLRLIDEHKEILAQQLKDGYYFGTSDAIFGIFSSDGTYKTFDKNYYEKVLIRILEITVEAAKISGSTRVAIKIHEDLFESFYHTFYLEPSEAFKAAMFDSADARYPELRAYKPKNT